MPDGMVRVTSGRRAAVVRRAFEADARALLAAGTLYDAAAAMPGARRLQGRGPVYAVALPVSRTHAVVRRNRHGGAFAAVTREFFLPPTRAPFELRISDRLRALGVPTPEVLMYGRTPAFFPFELADVVTLHLGTGTDLAELMMPSTQPDRRRGAWQAAGTLVSQLARSGVRHHDLNVKNIYIAESADGPVAHLLDVDRVTFGTPGDPQIHRANVARLQRSARKWRDTWGAVLDERDLAPLQEVTSAQQPGTDSVAPLPT